MRRILITGMSGVGKSTLVVELAQRGYRAVDLDDPAWSEYGYLDDHPTQEDSRREWLWREDRVAALLTAEDTDVLFVAGCAANQGRFYPHFDHIVLLTAPEAVTVHRLATRTTNRFGKDPAELAQILADKAAIEPLLRRGADVEIDSTASVDAVVEALVELVGSDAGST